MIWKQRFACTWGSGSQEPSGQTGAVPETSTRGPTRSALLNPMVDSKGEPDETRCRSSMASTSSDLTLGNQRRHSISDLLVLGPPLNDDHGANYGGGAGELDRGQAVAQQRHCQR